LQHGLGDRISLSCQLSEKMPFLGLTYNGHLPCNTFLHIAGHPKVLSLLEEQENQLQCAALQRLNEA